MTRYDVAFSRHAQADFDSILNFIANDNPTRALSFIDGLQRRAVEFLSTTPNAGSPLGKFRYTVFGRYIVAYSVDAHASRVRVVLVSEGHREWRRLLKDRG